MAEPHECGGSTVPALVMLCPACDEVGDVLTMFVGGVDPRFTVTQRDQMAATKAGFEDLIGPGRFDQAVAAMRDELDLRAIRDDELFAVLSGAALLVKLVDQYEAEVPTVDDGEVPPATDYAFGVLAALINERLPR